MRSYSVNTGLAFVVSLFMSFTVRAADLIWDNGSGDFLWNTTSTNWSGTATWSNSVPDNATFNATGAGTVSLGEAITAGTVGISAGAYTFSGAALTVTGGVSIASASAVTVNNVIAGDGSLSHTGSGNLTLVGNNTFTGGVYQSSGGRLTPDHNNCFGTGPVEVNAGWLGSPNGTRIIPNDITLTGTGGLVANVNRHLFLSGNVYLNNAGVNIAPGGPNSRIVRFQGTLNGTATYVNLGRGYTEIASGCTVTYGGRFHLMGNLGCNFDIGNGINLTNEIRVTASSIIGMQSLVNAEYSGNIDLQVDGDGAFDIEAVAGQTITCSGVISEDANGPGVDIIGAGTVILTGTNTYPTRTSVTNGTLLVNGDNSAATGNMFVTNNATLGGTGTIGGKGYISATNSPGNNSFGVLTFSSHLNYLNGAKVVWQLGANSAVNRGMLFDGIDVGGDLTFDMAVALALDFNQDGSTVDWTDPFWIANRQWLIWDVTGVTTGFGALSVTVADWADANGHLFNTVRPKSSFSLVESSGGIYLKYEAPLLGTFIMFM